MTSEEIGKLVARHVQEGIDAVARADDLGKRLMAAEAMLKARNTYIDEATAAHEKALATTKEAQGIAIEGLKAAHAARVADLEQDLREAKLREKEAQTAHDLLMGRCAQLGLEGVVGRAPAVNQKALRAIAGVLAPETERAPLEDNQLDEPPTFAGFTKGADTQTPIAAG